MGQLKFVAALCSLSLLFGCASIFGRSTNDPALKLQWASESFNSLDKPAEAEELIFDAIKIYKKENNDLGLAEAYRQYGLFLRSNVVGKFQEYFEDEGFADGTVNLKNRYEKAVDYFNKSKDLYEDYGHIEILSNLYISLAKTYDMMGQQKEACDSFDQGLVNYAEYKKLNPEARELRSEEMANYEEYIGIMKKQAGCTEQAK